MKYNSIRKILFKFNPETAHHLTGFFLNLAWRIPFLRRKFTKQYSTRRKDLAREVCGLKFRNPIGLAAGFDKDAKYYNALSMLGFGFIEIGTVTPKPQPGNPKPRLFRLVGDEAIINRMGFNNQGVGKAISRLQALRVPGMVIGGNIGKNTTTPNETAIDDYLFCFKELYDYVDYITVNVSCPNIKDLGALQSTKHLETILQALLDERKKQAHKKPIWLKISPDITMTALDQTLDLLMDLGIEGVIIANTSTNRSTLQHHQADAEKIGNGGLSGKPLFQRTLELVHYAAFKTKGKVAVIACGGISTPEDAQKLLKVGASLVQVFSGLIYKGPSLVRQIIDGLPK